MQIKRLFATALVLSAMLSVLAVAPAQAAPSNCRSTNLCVFWDTYYRGNIYHFQGTNSSWGPWLIEDDDSSWFNNGTSGMGVRVYHHRSFGGSSQCWNRGVGERIALLHQDRGSSNQWVSRC